MESTYFVHLCGALALRYLDLEALDELALTMQVGTRNERELAFDYLAQCASLVCNDARGALITIGNA